MKYNLEKIGKRIRDCRKAYRNKDYCSGAPDQATFGAILKDDPDKEYNRKTISNWEKGISLPPLDIMLRMCDLFECDLGYLLCEYDTKTRSATDIQAETGLSEDAINVLQTERLYGSRKRLINQFILDCEPIVESVDELENELLHRFFYQTIRSDIENEMQIIFDQIYDGDYPEYKKPLLFIERAQQAEDNILFGNYNAKTSFSSDGAKDRLYHEYLRFVEQREHRIIKYHKYNMAISFDRIIEKVINPEIMRADEQRLSLMHERNDEHGKHEKK